MIRRVVLVPCFALLMRFSGLAQEHLSAPRLGSVLFADGMFRNIEGVPGATRFTSAVDRTVYTAAVSASHARVILTATSASVAVGAFGLAIPERPIALALSPHGTHFAFIAGGNLTRCDVATRKHASTALVDLALDSDSAALAISDQGTVIVSDSRWLTITRTKADIIRVALPLDLPRFLPDSESALAFSRTGNALIMLDTQSLASERLLSAADGLLPPTGMEVSEGAVWISQDAPNSVLRYSLVTRSAAAFPLTSVGRIRPLGTPGIYLWSDVTLLDARRDVPSVSRIAIPAGEVN